MAVLYTSNVLSRFVDLLNPINLFLDQKRRCYPQLKNNAWIQDLIFLTDIMKHLQILNLALQGTEKIISYLAQTVFSFQNKIKVFQKLNVKNFPSFSQSQNVSECIYRSNNRPQSGRIKDKLQGLLESFKRD